MADQKLTVSEFAAKIKAKYPEYKDIDDLELSRKIVDKYPEYESVVVFEDQKKKEDSQEPFRVGVSELSSDLQSQETPEQVSEKSEGDYDIYAFNPIGRVIKNTPVLAELQSGIESMVGSAFKLGEMFVKENVLAYATANPAYTAAQNAMLSAAPIDNKLSQALGAMGDFYMDDAAKTMQDKWRDYGISEEDAARGIVGNIGEGNFGTAAKMAASTMVQQIPQLGVMAATGGTAGAVVLGATAAGGKYAEIQDDPTLSSQEKALYSLAVGTAEGVAENLFKTDVRQFARIFGKEGTKETFKKALKKELKKETLLKSFGEEAGEEFLVAVTDNLIENGLRGNFDNWDREAVLEIADNTLIGGLMGGSIHGLSRGVNAIGSTKNEREVARAKNNVTELMKKRENAKPEEQAIIDEMIEEEVGKLINTQGEDAEFYSKFTEQDRTEVLDLNKKIRTASKRYNVAPSDAQKAEIKKEIDDLRAKKTAIENKYAEEGGARYIRDGKEVSKEEFVEMVNNATPEDIATGQWGVENDDEVTELLLSKQPTEEAPVEQPTEETPAEEPVAEEPVTQNKETAEPTILVKNVEDQSIEYKDPVSGETVEGTLLRDGQQAVVETKDRIIELGPFSEVQDKPISELGIEVQMTPDVQLAGNKVAIRGKEYKSETDNIDDAVNYNDEGDVVSISLVTEDGKKRTFRGATAQEILYQSWLQKNASTPEDISNAEKELQELIDTDEEAREILTQPTEEAEPAQPIAEDADTEEIGAVEQELELDIKLLNEDGSDKRLTESQKDDPRNITTGKMTAVYTDKGILFRTKEDTGRMKEDGGEVFIPYSKAEAIPGVNKADRGTSKYAFKIAAMQGIAEEYKGDPVEELMSRNAKPEDLGKKGHWTAGKISEAQGRKMAKSIENFNKILKKLGAAPVEFVILGDLDMKSYMALQGTPDLGKSRGSWSPVQRRITINLDLAFESTLPHELLHAYLSVVKFDKRKISEFTNIIEAELLKGSTEEIALANRLSAFRQAYIDQQVYGPGRTKDDADIAEEFLAEYVGAIASESSGMTPTNNISLVDKIKAAVIKFLAKLNIVDKSLVGKIKSREEALDFINGFINTLQGRAEVNVNAEKSAVVNSKNPYEASRLQMDVPVGSRISNEPLKDARKVAISYMESKGMKHTDGNLIKKLDEKLSKRISDAYIAMKDNPRDPEVAAAYKALAEETIDQHEAIIKAGYKVEVNNNEPYNNSNELIEDLRKNKNMRIFSTDSGFGDEGITAQQRKDNPMLAETKYKDVNGRTLLVNDIFRFVHDFFGHAERGNGFGPIGEENAWDVHSRMFSPLARKALTAETRGQNSYVNFSGVNTEAFKLRDKGRALRREGKFEEAQEFTDKAYAIMKYAPQKVGLLPDEFVENPYLEGTAIEEEEQGESGEVGTINIPKQQIEVIDAPKLSEDTRSFVQKFVTDIKMTALQGRKFVTNMYDYTNAGVTILGNGYSIDLLGGRNYVPLMMERNGVELGEVSNLAAFNSKTQAEGFIRNAIEGKADLFAPHSGTLDGSWQFQHHIFEELVNLILDNRIMSKSTLIDLFNTSIQNSEKSVELSKSKRAEFKKKGYYTVIEKKVPRKIYKEPKTVLPLKDEFISFAETYKEKTGKNIRNLSSFRKDPNALLELLNADNNYSPDLRKLLNGRIASNPVFQKAIGVKSLKEFYNRISDPLNIGVSGGEIMSFVEFDPKTFKVVKTKPGDVNHHPSFGWVVMAKIKGVYHPDKYYKSYDITESYTKHNVNEIVVEIKAETTMKKFIESNISSSAGAIAKVAEVDIPKQQIDFAGIEMKTKETAGNTDPIIKTGGTAYVPVSTLYNLMDMRDGDRGGLYETAEDKKRVQELVKAFKKEGFEYKGSDHIYIDIDAQGYGWIGEGNHRVLAARELGMSHLPVRVEFGAARDGISKYANNYSRVPTRVISKEKINDLKEKAEPYYHIKYASIWNTDLPTNKEPSGDKAKQQIDWKPSLFGRGQVNPAIVNRTTEVQEAASELLQGKITNTEYKETVRITQAIEAITDFFLPASTKDMQESLDKNKGKLLNVMLEDGTEVGLRLDIPAYKNRNIWVVSIHDKGASGKSLSYGSVAWATDVKFGSNPKVASFIAAGKNMDTLKKQDKTTIARMLGKWKNFEGKTKEERDASAVKKVEEIVKIENSFPGAGRKGSPWRQVGMNPFRHSFFYDRRNGKPIVSAAEVVQIGGLVYAKDVEYADWSDDQFTVNGYKDADGQPVKFQIDNDPVSKVEEKQLTELEKGEIPKPTHKKAWYMRAWHTMFRTQLETEILKLQESKEGLISRTEEKSRVISNKIKKYAKTKEALALANEYLTADNKKEAKEKILALPRGEKLLSSLREARAFIDGISESLINDPAFEGLSDDLVMAIQQNLTTYLRTQYRFFTDKNFDINKRRDPAIQAQFKELMISEIALLNAQGLSPLDIQRIVNERRDEIRDEAVQMIDGYISDLEDVKYQPSKGGAGIKLPNAPFKRKQELPAYIEQLLGKEKNPINRFAQTSQALANVLYKGRMVEGILDIVGPNSDYILDEDPGSPKKKHYTKINDPYSKLNGKWVHNEITDALEQKPLYSSDKAWANGYFNVLKLARKSKVIWNITTWRKNLTGGWYFIMANGVANPKFAKDFSQRTKLMFKKTGETWAPDAETESLLDLMAEYGLIGKSIDANLIGMSQAAMQYGMDGDENAYNERAKRIWGNIKNKDKWLQEKYGAVDDYTKLIIFRSEIQTYAKKLYGKEYDSLTGTQKNRVHKEAAERVKESTPTFSRLPKWFDKVAVIPVVGDFVSFRLESLRSYGQNVWNGASDIAKSQEKGLTDVQKKAYLQAGLRRVAGSAAVFALKTAIVTVLSNYFLGDDDEELEDAAKLLRPEWMSGQTIIPRSIDKDGNVRVYNYSSEDPYGDVSDIFGGPESWSAMVKDFIRPNIAADLLFNLIKGEDIYGRKIADYSDSKINNIIKVSGYVGKQIVVPPTISSSFRDAYLRSDLPKKDKVVNLASMVAERSLIRDYKYNIVNSLLQDLRKISETRKSYEDYDNPAKRKAQLDDIREKWLAVVKIGNAKGNNEMVDNAEKYIKTHLMEADQDYFFYE